MFGIYLKEHFMFNEILNEVKIQDPYTKKWFDKTPEEYKKYYILFNKKYFNNELPEIPIENVTFKEADNPTNIGYSIFNINLNKQCLDKFSIKINKDYISNFDEFRNVLVHEMIHIYTYINVNIPSINWNKAFNYVKECNDNKNFVNDYTLKNILGIDNESSHKGKWKEKADYLNKNFPEFDDKLSEKYECSIDEDSYNDFIQKK